MKKVVPILLALLILLSSTCFAAYEPDPNRWIWLGSNDEVGIFLDKETIEYSTDKNTVECWICYVVPQKNIHAIVNEKIDRTTKTITMLHITEYESSSKKTLYTHTYSFLEQKPEKVIPESNGETIFKAVFPN